MLPEMPAQYVAEDEKELAIWSAFVIRPTLRGVWYCEAPFLGVSIRLSLNCPPGLHGAKNSLRCPR